jgi:rare lipoprotein A
MIKTIIMFFLFMGLGILPESVPEALKVENTESAPTMEAEEGIKYGTVSYYGERWNGRTTANMEIYDCNLLTCASPFLPFNTIVEITNLKNNKKVVVRVNDRGPYKMDSKGRALRPLIPHPKRVFDLSKAAFDSIGNLESGLLKVKYKIITEY